MNPNIFYPLMGFNGIIGIEALCEQRFDYDENNQPTYVGFSPYPGANPADPVWFIMRIYYDGVDVLRKRIPAPGVQFTYIWNQRSTYFPVEA